MSIFTFGGGGLVPDPFKGKGGTRRNSAENLRLVLKWATA